MITGILMVLLMSGLVNSNDCPKYNLSSSDQLLIDMIQHYLYSSRRTEVKAHSNTGILIKSCFEKRKKRIFYSL